MQRARLQVLEPYETLDACLCRDALGLVHVLNNVTQIALASSPCGRITAALPSPD